MTPLSKRPLFAAPLIAAAACGGEDAPTTAPAEIAIESVTAIDEIADAGRTINAAAFWIHPSLAFNSLLIVAAEDALTSFDIESGARVDRVEDVSLDGVALGYSGSGPQARGVAAVLDTGEGQFRFYGIDNIDRSFVLLPSLMVAPDGVEGFCLGRRAGGGGLALHVLRDREIASYELALAEAGVSVEASASAAAPEGLVDCAVDDRDGTVFALDARGGVHRYAEASVDPAPFTAAPARRPLAIELIVNTRDDDAAPGACCGQLAVLDGRGGVVHVFDRADGHALGAVEITASFDVQGVTAASAMGVGSGNFGATYRDGVIALATTSSPPVVRLAPWNGVLIALGQPVGFPINPREIAAPSGEEGLAIDIDVLDP